MSSYSRSNSIDSGIHAEPDDNLYVESGRNVSRPCGGISGATLQHPPPFTACQVTQDPSFPPAGNCGQQGAHTDAVSLLLNMMRKPQANYAVSPTLIYENSLLPEQGSSSTVMQDLKALSVIAKRQGSLPRRRSNVFPQGPHTTQKAVHRDGSIEPQAQVDVIVSGPPDQAQKAVVPESPGTKCVDQGSLEDTEQNKGSQIVQPVLTGGSCGAPVSNNPTTLGSHHKTTIDTSLKPEEALDIRDASLHLSPALSRASLSGGSRVAQSSQRLQSPLLNAACGSRVSASGDAIIVDPETAAAINFQNRHDPGSLEDLETEVEDMGAGSDPGDGLVSENSPLSGPQQHLQQQQSQDGSSSDLQALHQARMKLLQSGFPVFPQPTGVGADGLAASNTDDSASVWKEFSVNVRQVLLKHRASPTRPEDHTQSSFSPFFPCLRSQLSHGSQQPNCSYLERRPAGPGTRKPSFLQELILQQAEKHGKYVQWCPSMILALLSCVDTEIVQATRILASVLALRDNFIRGFKDVDSLCIPNRSPLPPDAEGSREPQFEPFNVEPLKPCSAEFRMEKGVIQVYWDINESLKPSSPLIPRYNEQPLLTFSNPIPTVAEFLQALKEVMAAAQHPACKTFAFRRLEYLRSRYLLHLMFNSAGELQETKDNQHRDFYNVRKVDTHVHHSACMHQKHLLRFIRKKYRTEPDRIVARFLDGRPVSLKEIFHSEVGTTAWGASVDMLNVHALGSCFQRFDIFNSKYNPFGQPILREVFLKTDNMTQGAYLAEITKEVMEDLDDGKYQFVEWRASIYGKNRDEWKKLALWVKNNRLSSKQVRWMVQVPRLYHVYRKLNLIQNFGDLLRNIFEPVFEAVKNPEAHPEIFHLLLQMNGWDSVDDESVVSKYTSEGGALPLPEHWTEPSNPPYSYWAYYMYANIRSLNELLAARGLRTLPFRPHCGEAGSISHLASMYLLADGINHGIMLRKSPALQYLYYLQQIGLALSPLSNNALFRDITKNPFYDFFSIGLNVSLSTDDPLMFHFTDEPLLEEYSCCAHVWKLSPVDLCEIARNSVLQSHFEPQFKRHWLGPNYHLAGKAGNDIRQTNVSNIRVQYREDTLAEELRYIRDVFLLQGMLDNLVPVTQ